MTTITATDVKKLRDQTGAGMMECKAALTEANGDFEEANLILRKRGLASAAKKAGRATSRRARSATACPPDHRSGILVEVNCESDFVARTPDFQQLVEDVITRNRARRRRGHRRLARRSERPDSEARRGRHREARRKHGACAVSSGSPGRARRATSDSTFTSRRRKDRRAGGVQRRRFTTGRARRVRDAGQRNRHADCGGQPVLRGARRRSGRHPRTGKVDLPGADGGLRESRRRSSTRSSKASSGASIHRSCCPISHPSAIRR